MSNICKECGNSLAENLSPQDIGEMLARYKSLYTWEDCQVGHQVLVPGLGEVELVHNSYHTVGDENGDLKMVWNTRYGLVAVEGYYSSYAGSQWDSYYKTAEKKTKEVVYFE
jgi:hypothetical protein